MQKNKIITKVLILLKSNPRFFLKHLMAKIKRYMPYPSSPVQKEINGVIFEFDFDYSEIMKGMYINGYEIETLDLMKRILKKGDTFLDVGANIGYFSAIAAGLVGVRGEIHSFEPVPDYFQRLQKMAVTNPDYKIIVNQYAVGEKDEAAKIEIYGRENIRLNSMVPNFINNEKINSVHKTSVIRLDSYIKEKALDNISLIKIDVEGFEFPVLKGLSHYFENTNDFPPIICEILPSAYPLLGCTLGQFQEYMEKYNYNAYSLVNTNIKLDITKIKGMMEVVFKIAK